ncbi:MAG: YqgE/AlgH family protein [Desulfuromonadales bacterium]
MIFRPLFLYLALVFLSTCLGVTENTQAYTPDKGMLLVATEHLPDPRFHNGVVLLIQHDNQGSAGLVLNRNSSLTLDKVLPQGTSLPGPGSTLSYGGPLEPQTLLALVKIRNLPPEPADEVMRGIYVTGLGVLAEWPDFAREVVAYRAFTGYAGWAPGQLERELQHGDWQIVPADEESVFTAEGEKLWDRLRNRQVPQQ